MKNLGALDRVMRLAGAAAAATTAALVHLSPLARIGLGAGATYLAASALLGGCLGYRLLGMSSCPRAR